MHLFPLLVACGVGPAPTFDESFAYDPSGGSLFDPPMAGCTEVDTWVSDDLVRGTLVYDEGGHLTSETWEAPDYFSLEEADWEAGCLTRYEGVEEVPEGTTTTGYFAECDRRGDPGEQSWTEDGAEELSGIERSVKDSNGWIKAEISSTLDLDEGGRSAHYQALTYLANFLSEDTGFVEWGGLPFRPSTSWTFDGERLLSRVYTICTAFGSEECLVWSEDHHTWDANGLLTASEYLNTYGYYNEDGSMDADYTTSNLAVYSSEQDDGRPSSAQVSVNGGDPLTIEFLRDCPAN